jgi:cholesterol oxidase
MMGARVAPDLRFHERMRGPVSFDTRDYNTAVVAGRRERNWCSVDLTTVIDDLDRFLTGPQSPARLEGTVHCPRLGGRLDVQEGTFHAFVRAPDERRRRVLYRLFLRDRENRPLTLSGFKLIEDDPNHDPWQDCSRLLVRLLAGHVSHGSEEDDDPRIVATGVLRITPLRFARTVLTMRGGPGRRLSAPSRYGLAFVRQLLAV